MEVVDNVVDMPGETRYLAEVAFTDGSSQSFTISAFDPSESGVSILLDRDVAVTVLPHENYKSLHVTKIPAGRAN